MTQHQLRLRRPPPVGVGCYLVRVMWRCTATASGVPPFGAAPRDTVKLREPPQASTTAAHRKVQCSTRVTTSGTVTAQRMQQWTIRSQTLRSGETLSTGAVQRLDRGGLPGVRRGA